MADGDFISTDHQFLIEYYWEDLVKRINISSSTLIDELLTLGVVTQKEGEDLKVLFIYYQRNRPNIAFMCFVVCLINYGILLLLYFCIISFNIQLEEKSCKRRGISDGPVVQKLLKLMLTKTNRHFKGLCEGLENEEQEYIVNQCLSKEGKDLELIFS